MYVLYICMYYIYLYTYVCTIYIILSCTDIYVCNPLHKIRTFTRMEYVSAPCHQSCQRPEVAGAVLCSFSCIKQRWFQVVENA